MKQLALLCLLISMPWATAQQTRPDSVNQKDGIAVGGYDLVSYTRGTPIQGSPEFATRHQGIRYLFTSERNLHLFQADPDRYLPAYGGWCAYAMARSGDRVEVDPEAFKIMDGRLLLFYRSGWNNTLKKWNREPGLLLEKADANWETQKPDTP